MYVAKPLLQTSPHIGHEPLIEHATHLSAWWIAPFVIFLLMIATGPLFYPRFWHRYYPYISIGMASGVILYYLFGLHSSSHVIHTIVEYVQFISLLTGLYFASSGIRININIQALARTNAIFLLIGGALANIIGTTGASMLLIRPFISLNKGRIQAYHVVFFIFVVSNIGGSLTPIGDPPLFSRISKRRPIYLDATA